MPLRRACWPPLAEMQARTYRTARGQSIGKRGLLIDGSLMGSWISLRFQELASEMRARCWGRTGPKEVCTLWSVPDQ